MVEGAVRAVRASFSRAPFPADEPEDALGGAAYSRLARARAEGKSVAGAAFAMLGGRKHGKPFAGAGGASNRYRARRDVARPVYCLRHGMEGCSHAPACRVLEVKQDVDAIKAVMEALR